MTLMEILKSAELIGLILAAVALGVGVWHVIELRHVMREAREQADEAKLHTAALDEVRKSLSTRYIGKFPEYYSTIVELLDRANHSIIIFCDFPAYGSFTDRPTWVRYHQTIERKSLQENMEISITCLDEAHRSEYVKEQLFKDIKGWDEWKQSERKRLEQLIKATPEAPNFDPLTREDLLAIFIKAEQQELKTTFAAATRKEIDTIMPLYFWLIDGYSAIFAIPSLSERAVEHGFSTTDSKLTSAFLEMRDRYHRGIAAAPNVSGEAPKA